MNYMKRYDKWVVPTFFLISAVAISIFIIWIANRQFVNRYSNFDTKRIEKDLIHRYVRIDNTFTIWQFEPNEKRKVEILDYHSTSSELRIIIRMQTESEDSIQKFGGTLELTYKYYVYKNDYILINIKFLETIK